MMSPGVRDACNLVMKGVLFASVGFVLLCMSPLIFGTAALLGPPALAFVALRSFKTSVVDRFLLRTPSASSSEYAPEYSFFSREAYQTPEHVRLRSVESDEAQPEVEEFIYIPRSGYFEPTEEQEEVEGEAKAAKEDVGAGFQDGEIQEVASDFEESIAPSEEEQEIALMARPGVRLARVVEDGGLHKKGENEHHLEREKSGAPIEVLDKLSEEARDLGRIVGIHEDGGRASLLELLENVCREIGIDPPKTPGKGSVEKAHEMLRLVRHGLGVA